MDSKFDNLKKDAAFVAESILSEAADKSKPNTGFGVMLSGGGAGGPQDDNAHTEQFFANEQKDLDFEHVDPQAFVQRMSAGAKEAQEELHAKFTKPLVQEVENICELAMNTANQRKQEAKEYMNVTDLTQNFMNAERGNIPKTDSEKQFSTNTITTLIGQNPITISTVKINDDEKLVNFDDEKTINYLPSAPLSGNQQQQPPQQHHEDDLINIQNSQSSQPSHPPSQQSFPFESQQPNVFENSRDFPQAIKTAAAAPIKSDSHDDDFSGLISTPLAKFNKDSDDSPSVSCTPSISCTPSPAKKMTGGALKEQDNDKFISSEDLLVDIKEERSAQASSASIAPEKPSSKESSVKYPEVTISGITFRQVPPTDLDDDDNLFDNVSEAITSKPSVAAAAVADTFKSANLPAFNSSVETCNEAFISAKDDQPLPSTSSKANIKSSNISEDPHQPKLLSVEQLFYKYGLDAWFKPERLHPQVESLIYWRDVKKSGIVFGVGVATILAISCFSVISVFAWLSLILLVGSLAFRCYKNIMQALQKTSDGHPFEEFLKIDLTISQEKVQHIAGVAVAHLNGFTAELRRLFLVEDFVDSIKFGFLLYVMTYIGAWLNGMTLVLLAFISLFTLPKLYENNKESIDSSLDLVLSKITEVTDKVKAALPMSNKKPVVAESDKDK